MSHNNEPGYGKNIGDTLGAVAARLAKNHAMVLTILDVRSLATTLDATALAEHTTPILFASAVHASASEP